MYRNVIIYRWSYYTYIQFQLTIPLKDQFRRDMFI